MSAAAATTSAISVSVTRAWPRRVARAAATPAMVSARPGWPSSLG